MKIFFLVLFSLLSFYSWAQPYKIVNCIQTKDSIGKDDDVDNICFKMKNNKAYQLRRINATKDKYDLKITRFDVPTGGITKCDTVSGLPSYFYITDFTFDDKRMLICSMDRYMYFDINDFLSSFYMYPDQLRFDNDSLPFKYCEILNDSLILLSMIYNYHPADGSPGLYMHILNTNTKTIIKSTFLKFPGIALSHLSSNWLTVIKDKIYVINPLSALVDVFNFNLQPIGRTAIALFNDSEQGKNALYGRHLDSIIAYECNRITELKAKYAKGSPEYIGQVHSSIYSKDFISNTIETVENNYTYVQNTFSVDDSLIAIALSRPGYHFTYRDLLFYDPVRDKILAKYIRFPCSINGDDTLTKPEDFYRVNVASIRTGTPCFHDGYVSTGSIYPMSLYKNGNVNDVTNYMYQSINKYGYVWSIINYRLQ